MNKDVNSVKPMDYFMKICEIPHKSADEGALIDFLIDFAKERNLSYEKDDILNLIIRKPGSAGREKDEPLVFQAHVDMVYVADKDAEHKYEEPLDLCIEGDKLSAKGTSLGADDGIGVAMMLALLDEDRADHPPYEMLFTTQEEDGLLGALELSDKWITGKTLINLDGEVEDDITCGCAGGFRGDITIKTEYTDTADNMQAVNLKVTGLKGGHSGLDIGLNRANANKVLGRILDGLYKKYGISICSISGGTKMNVIPSLAEAEICFDKALKAELIECVNGMASAYYTEFKEAEPGLSVVCEDIACPPSAFDDKSTANVISAINLMPNGVLYRNEENGLIETSNNLGVIESVDGNVNLVCNPRSSISSHLLDIRKKLNDIGSANNGDVNLTDGYPAWEYRKDSHLREIYVSEFTDYYGHEPNIEVIHAGLECGIILEKYPEVDAVSVGPTIVKPHSTEETVGISSIDRSWELLQRVIDRL